MTGLQINLARFFALYGPDSARSDAIARVYDSKDARDRLRGVMAREMETPNRRAYARGFLASLNALEG